MTRNPSCVFARGKQKQHKGRVHEIVVYSDGRQSMPRYNCYSSVSKKAHCFARGEMEADS